MESCSNQKSVKQIKIYFIFEILQSRHPLPSWKFCTHLAFSQPASPGMLFQQSWRSSHICWALVGCFSLTLRFNSSHTISIGLRSGDCGQVICCSSPSLYFLVKYTVISDVYCWLTFRHKGNAVTFVVMMRPRRSMSRVPHCHDRRKKRTKAQRGVNASF